MSVRCPSPTTSVVGLSVEIIFELSNIFVSVLSLRFKLEFMELDLENILEEIEGISEDDVGEDELLAQVTDMLGANRVTLSCFDGEERQGRIPGRMRNEEWIRLGDIVIAKPWSWQDEKADIERRLEENISEDIKRLAGEN